MTEIPNVAVAKAIYLQTTDLVFVLMIRYITTDRQIAVFRSHVYCKSVLKRRGATKVGRGLNMT